MLSLLRKLICVWLTMTVLQQAIFAAPEHISLELKAANLQDTIRLLAKFLCINVILSPTVHGKVTLHLAHASPEHVFNLLLTSHDLVKWPVGRIWFIAPRKELMHQKEEELKWQTIQDEMSHLITKVVRINYGKAEDIAKLIKDSQSSLMSKRGQIRVDSRTNSICLQDIPKKMAEIYLLVKRLDIPSKQILIDARIASVDNDFERDLGIHFGVTHPSENKNPVISSGHNQYNLAIVKLADGSLLDVKLSALENNGHAELISRPTLFTANQQPALIEAGEDVPYQEVSESGGTAVAFKKAVLGLKVIPQILPGNKVLLQLQINQDRPSNKMVLGVPTISTRQITTNVLVKSGETIVLGGILEMNHEIGQKGLPFLNQIPLLGWLFTEQNTKKNKRELLIFVTPQIIA